ncbi:MAG: NADH-quinone oxidoreductase subunit J [Planctomycetes bacterium]|jgi:NADH:ubiquinone oxidoreductase subunit 6 (subunit J)|nr:NADH-quinone oxidoreductase subunit J [Planctomycetota bacterium]MCL4730605.1 NADH-quinone oxidoreductase subunit J [Planctomycetota bacterium]
MEVLFLISALVCVLGTLILLTQRNAVYALLGLLIAFFGSAGVFRALDAPFIAVAQILIYAGALAVMFLFVLMFTDTRTQLDALGVPGAVGARPVYKPGQERKQGEAALKFNPLEHILLPQPLAAVVAVAFLLCVSFAIYKLPPSFNEFGPLPAGYDSLVFTPGVEQGRNLPYGSTEAVSKTIFEGFPLAFEIVSLLIFAAILGAVLLARRHLAGIPGSQDAGREATGTDEAH